MNDTKEKETEQTKTGSWPEIRGIDEDDESEEESSSSEDNQEE